MIAVAGLITADILTYPVTTLPELGTLEPVQRIEVRLGGSVANTGAALARLGIPVAAVGRIGNDLLGTLVVEEAARWADTHWLIRDPVRSTSATVVLLHPDGERSFFHAAGAETAFSLGDIPLEALQESGLRVLHLGYALLLPSLDGNPMIHLFEKVREQGILISLDVTSHAQADWPSLLPILPLIDVFCPNRLEAELLTGLSDPAQAAEALIQGGVRQIVAIKLGAEGSYVRPAGGPGLTLPGLSVRVVDTTGAGDAFLAGLLAAWYRGLDWHTAARVANVVGTMSVTGSGAGGGVEDWESTLDWTRRFYPQAHIPKFRDK